MLILYKIMLSMCLDLTNKLSLLTFIALVIATSSSFGQTVGYARDAKEMNEFADQWFEGEVTFKNGETILCELSYNPLVPEGLVKIADGDRILTETVYSLESFSYYDPIANSDHTYYPLEIGNRKRAFIELLHENSHYSILGRKEIELENQHWEWYLVPGIVAQGGYHRTKLEENYQRYLFDIETGELRELGPKKVIELTGNKKKEIKKFIRANKLKFNTTADYIAVLNEYHRLTK